MTRALALRHRRQSDGLVVGGSATYTSSRRAADATVTAAAGSIREIILGAHLALLENRIHVINE